MVKTKNTILLLLFGLTFVLGGDLQPKAAGNMEIAIPNADYRLNLYRSFGNSAWLLQNDARNWMIISTGTHSAWGTLRRFWDPYGRYVNAVNFSGQKHVSPNQIFYGAIQYNMDYYSKVNKSIELEPYADDPFVLCDSTEGDFVYSGPTVRVVFSNRAFKKFWWGVGLNYKIYRGLKKIYSLPEIIRRNIQLDVSLAYKMNRNIVLGFSFKPYDFRDLTNIVKQPDGTNPVIYRYRGEFEFTSVTSKSDRTAIYNGMEIEPQIMLDYYKLKGVFAVGYYYRWNEVYDGDNLHLYDGFYQGQHYYLKTAWRYYLDSRLRSSITFRYHFRYLQDWAEEPVKKYAIYRSFQRKHQITVGVSKKFSVAPLTLAAEGQYHYWLPNKKDYLAHVYRETAITDLRLSAGGIWQVNGMLNFQAGLLLNRFREPAIWHYFGDYDGLGGTCGFSYKFKMDVLQLYMEISRQKSTNTAKKKTRLNMMIQFKQAL